MAKLGPVMSAEEFTRFQVETAHHLSFSLTLACPLKCAHCMVSTISPRQAASATMPLALAQRFAAEMPALAAIGIRRLSFTGGEPLLARAQLAALSEAAHAAGISSTVVTACHWARTPAAADRTVSGFSAIRRWHLSADVYHSDFVDPGLVVNAALAVVRQDGEASVRMAVSRGADGAQQELVAWLRARLPQGVPIVIQPVAPVGRAREIGIAPAYREAGDVPATPCLTTGPLIDHAGRLLPCCSGLAEMADRSPFASLDAAETGLAAAVAAWRNDPLLTLVRGLGFAFPASWAMEAGVRPPDPPPEHPCDYCTALWSTPGARAAVLARAEAPDIASHIGALGSALFTAAADAAAERSVG